MTNSNSRPSEFQLIAALFAPLATAPGAFGLKDDAAVIPARAGHDLVVTTDAIVEGVDFFSDDPAPAVAQKALRVNLSDLAAKGAEPFGYLLNLALPPAVSMDWLTAFAQGLREDQARYAASLLGGDTGATPGPLSVVVTAFGYVQAGRMVRRNGARPGDRVFVTGAIGDSGGGLAVLNGEGAALAAAHREALVTRYRVPEPPVGLAPWIGRHANAAIDVSDGLIADLGHVAEASGVRIVVEAPRIPRSEALVALWGDDVVRAATAGDDYQVVFTGTQGPDGATCIGRVEAGAGVALVDAQGREIAVPRPGFRHF